MTSGTVGWLGVGVAVVAADAWAKTHGGATMSDLFYRFRYWSVPAWAAVTAHLLLHEEQA